MSDKDTAESTHPEWEYDNWNRCEVRIEITPNAWHFGYALRLLAQTPYADKGPTLRWHLRPAMVPHQPGQLIERDDALPLSEVHCQSLLQALWDYGFRPEGIETDEQVAALKGRIDDLRNVAIPAHKKHIDDLRAVAFDQLKIDA